MVAQKTQQLKAQLTHGVAPAMATPLKADGLSVDEKAIHSLVDFLIASGASGLFVGGTTGEGILLSLEQRRKLHDVTVQATGGRVPVILHVGANTTAESVALSAHADALHPAAIAAVSPYFYGVDDESILRHYQAVAAAAPALPFLAYDIPHLAMNSVRPTLLPALANGIPTFAGMKTSNGNAQIVRESLSHLANGAVVLAGNERIALALLALGADGLISGLSTAIPEPFVALTQAFAAADLKRARELQFLINSLLDLIPGGRRIGALKSILEARGLPVGPPVPPRMLPPDTWRPWPQMSEMLASAGVPVTR